MTPRILGIALAAAAAAPALAGEVKGTIHFKGALPALAPLVVGKDPARCGETVPNQSVEVSDGHLRNVVVTVDARRRARPVPRTLAVDQLGCRYVPRVQVAPVGSTLQFRNGDPVLHNVRGRLGGATVFNVAMPLQGMQVPRALSKEGVVQLACDVHPFMEGWVVVTDQPAAVSGKDGTFVVGEVPPGTWAVTAWHERYGKQTRKVSVPATGAAKVDFVFAGP